MAEEVLEDIRFTVDWGGQSISMLRISPLTRSYTVVTHRDSADPATLQHKQAGVQIFPPILLERHVKPKDLDFQNWMDQVKSSPAYRRDIVIRILDAQLNTLIAFNVKACWPSDYEAFAELDANNSNLLVERLTLENEGWTRIDA